MGYSRIVCRDHSHHRAVKHLWPPTRCPGVQLPALCSCGLSLVGRYHCEQVISRSCTRLQAPGNAAQCLWHIKLLVIEQQTWLACYNWRLPVDKHAGAGCESDAPPAAHEPHCASPQSQVSGSTSSTVSSRRGLSTAPSGERCTAPIPAAGAPLSATVLVFGRIY